MPDDDHQLRRVAWRDVCRWLIIFKCLSTAISIPLLVLATAAALLVPCGLAIADVLFQPHALTVNDDRPKLHERMLRHDRWPGSAPAVEYDFSDRLSELGQQSQSRIRLFFQRFVGSWRYVFVGPTSVRDTSYFLFHVLWMLLVWSLFGGAIARMAVVKLGREERIGMWEALRHTFRKYRSYVVAPLLPLIGIFFGLLFFWVLGALMRMDFGVIIAALAWPLAIIAAFVLTVLLLGLIFGWPFMWVALGTETDGDSLDAISHAYTYALWRPVHYLAYATLALLVGVFGFLLVYHASEILLAFIRHGVLWAAGEARTDELAWIFSPRSEPAPESRLVWFGGWIMRLLNGLVRTIAAAYAASYFFCAASAMYLLLRYDNERTEFDEVLVEDEEALQLPGVEPPPPAAKVEPTVVLPPSPESPPDPPAASDS